MNKEITSLSMKTSKNCGIYKITSPSGKIYIGQSKDIKSRFANYNILNQTEKQIALHRSFLKYGIKNHHFDVIEYCSEEDLNCSERFWQDEFDVLSRNGLNCMLTECGQKIKVLSEESKRKISEAQKGELNHMFGKVGKLNPFYGRLHTKETKNLISEKAIERYELFGHPSRGKKLSEETKNKISETKKEFYKNNDSPLKGVTLTEERKEKMSKTIRLKGNNIRGKNPKAKLVLDLQSGIFYDCLKDASEVYDINYKYLKSMVNPNSKCKNKTSLIYC